jgi:hypothetical protein
MVGLLSRKLSSLLRPIEDLALKMPGVYSIASVGKCTLNKLSVQLYCVWVHVYHSEKSAVAEHSINIGHLIQLMDQPVHTVPKPRRTLSLSVSDNREKSKTGLKTQYALFSLNYSAPGGTGVWKCYETSHSTRDTCNMWTAVTT